MVDGYLNTELCLAKNSGCARDWVLDVDRNAEGEKLSGDAFFCSH